MPPKKKQLRAEIIILEELINRYGGKVSLWNAYDNVSVELDYLRGSCVKRKKEKGSIENGNEEYESWI